jgi:hypothetical protein
VDKLEKILAHHGVLGMRWGFRKPGTGAASSHRKATGVSKDKAKANKAQSKIGKRGNTDRLNNDELQHLVNRLNLEKQYSSISSQTTKSNPVGKFLKNIAVNVARKQIQAAANDVVAKQVKAALKAKGMT